MNNKSAPAAEKRWIRKRGWPSIILVLILSLTAPPLITWKYFEYRFQLGLLPQGIGVWWISYRKNESWGFGPGSNETGVITYALPGQVAQVIEKDGVAYLDAVGNTQFLGSRRRSFSDWKSTPVDGGELGKYRNLSAYLNRYGFGIHIRKDVESYINSVIASPGSYYAYERIGVVVVDPVGQKVVFFYSG